MLITWLWKMAKCQYFVGYVVHRNKKEFIGVSRGEDLLTYTFIFSLEAMWHCHRSCLNLKKVFTTPRFINTIDKLLSIKAGLPGIQNHLNRKFLIWPNVLSYQAQCWIHMTRSSFREWLCSRPRVMEIQRRSLYAVCTASRAQSCIYWLPSSPSKDESRQCSDIEERWTGASSETVLQVGRTENAVLSRSNAGSWKMNRGRIWSGTEMFS